jgi:hypothetical protein
MIPKTGEFCANPLGAREDLEKRLVVGFVAAVGLALLLSGWFGALETAIVFLMVLAILRLFGLR